MPAGLLERRSRVRRIVDQLSRQLGRPPTTSEIAVAAHVNVREVPELQTLPTDPVAVVPPEALERAVATRDSGDEGVAFWPAFRTLDQRERHVVYLRFFEDLTQAKIGELLGVSQVHVSRLLQRAVAKMQEEFGM
jgi:RNA polymerase sigma factor (sigma-70 family)